MRLKLLSILGLALLFTACSNDEDYLFKEFEKTDGMSREILAIADKLGRK
ncbi:hypothetical protein [Bacteroides acidifaciens]|nr:hypothetical protein [Bacteroides acidifaciens]